MSSCLADPNNLQQLGEITRRATAEDGVAGTPTFIINGEKTDADRWSRLARAPLHGLAQAVVWTGHELLVWGGVVPTPAGTNAPVRYLDTGAAFTPIPERSAP